VHSINPAGGFDIGFGDIHFQSTLPAKYSSSKARLNVLSTPAKKMMIDAI
jgi:hypothetical protein